MGTDERTASLDVIGNGEEVKTGDEAEWRGSTGE